MTGRPDGDSSGAARGGLRPLCARSGAALRVLLTEDVPTNQLIARRLLRGFGCHVEVAADGKQALVAVMQGGCDVVLMDVAMPEMDGLEATRRIRALGGSFARLPILGLTAGARADERQSCLDAGMNRVLAKPIRPEALYEALSDLVDDAQQAPYPEGAPVGALDRELLAELTDGLDAALVDELLQRAAADIDTHTATAMACAGAADIDGLARACHIIKGLAGSFGIGELARLARDIEQRCRAGDGKGATAAALGNLDAAAVAARVALDEFRQPPGAAAR